MPNDISWLDAARAAATSGLVRIGDVRRIPEFAAAAWQYGPTPATLLAVNAIRTPAHPAVIDELGVLTYGRLRIRAAAIAAALYARAGGKPRVVAVLCRNHRGFVEGILAASQLGSEIVLLNTELPQQQLERILARHRPEVLIHDAEYEDAISAANFPGLRITAWTESATTGATLDSLATETHPAPPPQHSAAHFTMLTSGTTGVAKGVSRPIPRRALVELAATAMATMRLSRKDIALIGPPFFHGFGVAALVGALTVGATVLCHRRFDPAGALAAIEKHGATVFFGVPVMLQRLLDVPEEQRKRYVTRSLRLAVTGAAPITPTTVSRFIDAFGPILLNGYGSTEAGIISIAAPDDLRRAPKTAGRPAIGVSIRILRADRTPARTGETGTIFIRGGIGFHGYTPDPAGDPAAKEVVDGHLNTGDMGHFDAAGRLYIDGRDDDMIVSGGENIYPGEVENALATHPAIAEVAVTGIAHPEYGQVLRAYLVTAAGRAEPSAQDLKDHLGAALERYKIPKEFVFLDSLPRNATGKLLKTRLPQQN
ncbi:AMP-binding protein [Nocardia inohanensis]|uniref:AMP-binding protein n=1 Tax=Nocardia inohanensis TaxID=209246 RepID=UPI000A0320D6|nr:AMP-binding protein [Nocardia inohanensis]